MTAEQFWFDGHVCKQHKNACCDECMQHAARADAHAAAQLVEKEREIERLKSLVMSLRPSTLEARAEAAEQRLQEAQAEIELLRHNRNEALKDEDDTD